MGTLTYDYHNSTVVLGPMATVAEPHSYDLCAHHLDHLTVPKGWDVVRLDINYEEAEPSADDLMALVEAVREAAGQTGPVPTSGFAPFSAATTPSPNHPAGKALRNNERRGHLEIIDGDAEGRRREPKEEGTSKPEQGPY